MDKSTIQTLIDKVIGKKGLIRVPSWWMRKVLMQMADWVQEGNDANSEKIVKIDEDTTKLRNLTLPYMLVSGTGIVNIDGNRISFTDADKQLIFITGAINFKKGDNYNDNPIAYIYIPHLDVRSQGRDMAFMFYRCSGLTSLNVAGFDTSSVMNMDSMFNGCRKLTSLDLSSFNTSVVTSMEGMFYSCLSLTSLNLSSFDTSMVTNLWMLFDDCKSLTSLILGPNFFKASYNYVDFSYSTQWTNDTVVTSLVTNSYDRATAGLSTMTLKLSANTKAALTDEQKAAITAKGYTIA